MVNLHPSHAWEKTPDPLLLARAAGYGWNMTLNQLEQCQACMIQSFEPGADSECACPQEQPAPARRARDGEEKVDHPPHYGGADNVYEAIKVIEAWSLGFCLGNAVKYICRAGKKRDAETLDDLKKARWYLDREIQGMEPKEAKKA